jgi:dihydrofolate reductase
MRLGMILAMDMEGGIGKDNELPWYSKEDFAYFKEMTEGSVVVMGMNTYKSLPMYPLGLPNRKNLVICREPENEVAVEGVTFVTLEQIKESTDRAWLIGGAHTFYELKDQVEIVSVTVMKGEYECDTFVDIEDFTDDKILVDDKELSSDAHVYMYVSKVVSKQIA